MEISGLANETKLISIHFCFAWFFFSLNVCAVFRLPSVHYLVMLTAGRARYL